MKISALCSGSIVLAILPVAQLLAIKTNRIDLPAEDRRAAQFAKQLRGGK